MSTFRDFPEPDWNLPTDLDEDDPLVLLVDDESLLVPGETRLIFDVAGLAFD